MDAAESGQKNTARDPPQPPAQTTLPRRILPVTPSAMAIELKGSSTRPATAPDVGAGGTSQAPGEDTEGAGDEEGSPPKVGPAPQRNQPSCRPCEEGERGKTKVENAVEPRRCSVTR